MGVLVVQGVDRSGAGGRFVQILDDPTDALMYEVVTTPHVDT